jgi:hypothetical protein
MDYETEQHGKKLFILEWYCHIAPETIPFHVFKKYAHHTYNCKGHKQHRQLLLYRIFYFFFQNPLDDVGRKHIAIGDWVCTKVGMVDFLLQTKLKVVEENSKRTRKEWTMATKE